MELILQGTIFPFFTFNGAYPDLILITIVCLSIILKPNLSYKLGLIGGLLVDIMFGTIIGLYGLSFLITAFIISKICEVMFKESIVVPIIFFPVGVVINHTIIFLTRYLLNANISFLSYIGQFSLYYWIVNIIFTILLYPLFLKLLRE